MLNGLFASFAHLTVKLAKKELLSKYLFFPVENISWHKHTNADIQPTDRHYQKK